MKLNILGGLAVSALLIAGPLSAASAADMALKAPPPVPVVWNWTGGYVGANVGYSWGRWDSNDVGGTAIFPSPGGLGTTDDPNVKGWLGGFQAGYNYKFRRNGSSVLRAISIGAVNVRAMAVMRVSSYPLRRQAFAMHTPLA